MKHDTQIKCAKCGFKRPYDHFLVKSADHTVGCRVVRPDDMIFGPGEMGVYINSMCKNCISVPSDSVGVIRKWGA